MRHRMDSDDMRAVVTRKWLDMERQKDIAREFGYQTAAPVNKAIVRFISKWCPEDVDRDERFFSGGPGLPYGDDRRDVAARALRNWAAHKAVYVFTDVIMAGKS